MWKNKFTEVILQRGYFYYVEKRVTIIEESDMYVEAKVMGSQNYQVSIDFYDHYIVHMECDCPYAIRSHNCKHMAAVLYELKEREKTQDYDISKIMQKASSRQIEQFLSLLLVNNDALMMEFDRFLNYKLKEDVLRYFQDILKKANQRYEIHSEDNEALAFKYYLEELNDYIDSVVAEMLLHHYASEAFTIISLIYDDAITKEDYYDYFIDFLEDLSAVWILIYAQASKSLKQEMYFWFSMKLDLSDSDEIKMILKQMKTLMYNNA